MTDLAARIRERLAFHDAHRRQSGIRAHGRPPVASAIEVAAQADAYAAAIEAVLEKCDKISLDNWGEPYYPGIAFASAFRDAIAEALGLSDSPAVASAGVQPKSVTAGAPTLTNGLIIAVGVELKSRVWEHGMPPISDAQLTELVEVVVRLVREHDADQRWVKAERRAEWAADAGDRGGCD